MVTIFTRCYFGFVANVNVFNKYNGFLWLVFLPCLVALPAAVFAIMCKKPPAKRAVFPVGYFPGVSAPFGESQVCCIKLLDRCYFSIKNSI